MACRLFVAIATVLKLPVAGRRSRGVVDADEREPNITTEGSLTGSEMGNRSQPSGELSLSSRISPLRFHDSPGGDGFDRGGVIVA